MHWLLSVAEISLRGLDLLVSQQSSKGILVNLIHRRMWKVHLKESLKVEIIYYDIWRHLLSSIKITDSYTHIRMTYSHPGDGVIQGGELTLWGYIPWQRPTQQPWKVVVISPPERAQEKGLKQRRIFCANGRQVGLFKIIAVCVKLCH